MPTNEKPTDTASSLNAEPRKTVTPEGQLRMTERFDASLKEMAWPVVPFAHCFLSMGVDAREGADLSSPDMKTMLHIDGTMSDLSFLFSRMFLASKEAPALVLQALVSAYALYDVATAETREEQQWVRPNGNLHMAAQLLRSILDPDNSLSDKAFIKHIQERTQAIANPQDIADAVGQQLQQQQALAHEDAPRPS